jgi:hypothetical protein
MGSCRSFTCSSAPKAGTSSPSIERRRTSKGPRTPSKGTWSVRGSSTFAPSVRDGASRTSQGANAIFRFAKSLVQVGASHDDTYGAETGQALELLPEGDPMQIAPGGALPVLVKFHGRPLAGARVWALSRVDASVHAAPYVTHDEGVASFPIDRRGFWLVRMTHMVRCEGCTDAEWETFWASYFFATPFGRRDRRRPFDVPRPHGGQVTAQPPGLRHRRRGDRSGLGPSIAGFAALAAGSQSARLTVASKATPRPR